MAKTNKIFFSGRINDFDLKEKAMDIIQNKLKITTGEYLERELKKLVKRWDKKNAKNQQC
jgi:hypothetical protein